MVLAYRLWPHVGHNTGLLLDEITYADTSGNVERLDRCIDDMLARYRSVIYRTLQPAATGDVINKLYAERAAPGGRLDAYYQFHPPWEAIAPDRPHHRRTIDLVINGRERHLDFSRIRDSLRRHFAYTVVWAAVTQGDPTDLNIGWSPDAGPVWFDYDTGGTCALAGEFSCFLLYQRLHGSWLTPKYNQVAFRDHPAVLTASARCSPIVRMTRLTRGVLKIDYTSHAWSARRHVMRRYLDELVHPVAAHLHIDDVVGWLRPYLVMRLLAVYDVTKLHPSDAGLIVGLLADLLDPAITLDGFLDLTNRDEATP